jgi:hypothetical protein
MHRGSFPGGPLTSDESLIKKIDQDITGDGVPDLPV